MSKRIFGDLKMGTTQVIFRELVPKLGRCLETNSSKAAKIFESVFAKEKSLQKAEFGELYDIFGEIPKIRLNAQDISQFNERTRNMLLNLKSSSLREACTSLVAEASDAAVKGWDYLKYIDSILENASLLDVQKDKRVISELSKIMKSFTKKLNKLRNGKCVDTMRLENEFTQAQELALIPAQARGEVTSLRGRVCSAAKRYKLGYGKDFEESMKQESLVDFFTNDNLPHIYSSKLEFTKEFEDFLYNEYYIKRHSFGLGADEPLRAINEFYGTKVFVPLKASEETTDDILREFHAWNKAGGKEVILEKVLTFDDYDPELYSKPIAGFANCKNFIRVQKNYFKIIENYPLLRHEKMHRNDLLKLLGKNEHFGFFGKNKQYDFTPNGKILTEKKWYRDEFRKAGIPEWHIDYAYTNRAEFIAVAAEGDVTKYSEEFKQVLIELGVPKWFFKIRKFKSYNT